MRVSLVSTVKDAEGQVGAFVEALRAQTRPPDDVVVVDGGSTDGTLGILRAARRIRVISNPGANISRGRNVAILAAAHDVVAVTDADCVPDPTWLERLLRPIEAGADVAAGFYRPAPGSLVQTLAAAVSVPERKEIRDGWMPSSRSIAFRRGAYQAAGGYPEWLDIGEDMYFNHRLLQTRARFALATDAVVTWTPRPTLAATWRQYAGYGEGDALAGMYPRRHLIRFAAYGLGLAAAASRRPPLLALAAAGAAAYAAKPIRRAFHRLPPGPERAAGLAALPAMIAFVDAAKAYGYLRGTIRARTGPGRGGAPRSHTGSPA